MGTLPSGIVTFLFTDIEGSTALWEQHRDTMRQALVRHDALVEQIVDEHQGHVVRPRGEGDSRFAVFALATDAVTAAAALQQALHAELWTTPTPLRVRMAIHTGEADLREGDYYGSAVNRCARLRAVAHGGQALISAATQELVRDHLPHQVALRDLGEQRLRDLIRPEHIFQLTAADIPHDFPALKTLDNVPNNLPLQPTPLIGREQEVAAVRQRLLQPRGGIVTLTGPGGTGKTRLALQVAAELLDDFIDGVFVVDLAPISDPTLVPSAIATTLGVKGSGGQPVLESLKAWLARKQVLLILDNFEQVVAAARVVPELLAAAAGLKVLVTSREPLHLRGEQEYPVPPLSLPASGQLPTLERLSQYAAVALFIARAQDVKPDFQVTNANAPAVAEICVRLDGLPLAIELAAARIKVLPPATLLARLEHRLRMLTGGARDLEARQQTLRGAIDWSYQLLTAAEQRLFARLAVFVGGCTLEAAEAVCNAGDFLGDDRDLDVLDGLQSLVDKSLLRQQEGADAEPRFTMLETIHEYARERLEASGEGNAMKGLHADYYVVLAEAGAPELYFRIGTPALTWLERMQTEQDNLRASMRWVLDQRQSEPALRLSTTLWHFWGVRGYASEGRSWLAEALQLAASEATASALRARGLYAAAILAGYQSDTLQSITLLAESAALFREAGDKCGGAWALLEWGESASLVIEEAGRTRALWDESLMLFREAGDMQGLIMILLFLSSHVRSHGEEVLGQALLAESTELVERLTDKPARALALHELAWATVAAGDYPRARSLFAQSLSLYREIGDRLRLANALSGVAANARDHGDYEWANALGEESVSLFVELGDKGGLASALLILGELALMQGNDARALEVESASAALYRELGNKVDMCWPQINLAYLAQHQKDYLRASALAAECLAIMVEARFVFGIAVCLAALGGVATGRLQTERAARLFGAAERLYETAGIAPAPAHQIEIDRNGASARARLDESIWEAAWAEGQAMTMEQAAAYALEATAPE